MVVGVQQAQDFEFKPQYTHTIKIISQCGDITILNRKSLNYKGPAYALMCFVTLIAHNETAVAPKHPQVVSKNIQVIIKKTLPHISKCPMP
jgi:hypothetical protein